MNRNLAIQTHHLPVMSREAIAKVYRLEEALSHLPQVELETTHVLHAGVYLRTVRVPAGVVVTGALIKIATTLVVSGAGIVFIGDETLDISGYHVIPASAGRKQAFLAHTDTDITMLFHTHATTVGQAEDEFTDESDRLQTRKHHLQEALCQA